MSEKIKNLANVIRQEQQKLAEPEGKTEQIPNKPNIKRTVKTTTKEKKKENGTIQEIQNIEVDDSESVRMTMRLPKDIHVLLSFISSRGFSKNKIAVYALQKLLEDKEIKNLIEEKLKEINT